MFANFSNLVLFNKKYKICVLTVRPGEPTSGFMHLNEQLATSKKILERQVDAVHPNRSSLTAYSSSFFTRSVYIAIEQTNINESSLNVLNFSMGLWVKQAEAQSDLVQFVSTVTANANFVVTRENAIIENVVMMYHISEIARYARGNRV